MSPRHKAKREGGPAPAAQVLERILQVDYSFPTSIPVSAECKDLLSRILVADPAKRYTIEDIQQHPWWLPQRPCLPTLAAHLCVALPGSLLLCMLAIVLAAVAPVGAG